MKIKLGSFITDARGTIGGSVVQVNTTGLTLKAKKGKSTTRLRNLNRTKQLLRNASHQWRTLTTGQRSTWKQIYGNLSTGYKKYVQNQYFKSFLGSAYSTTVSRNAATTPLSLVNITYNNSTKLISVTLGTNGSNNGTRIIQVSNVSNSATRKIKRGWTNGATKAANVSTPFTINPAGTLNGVTLNNTTSFSLRIIQVSATTYPLIILNCGRFYTGNL